MEQRILVSPSMLAADFGHLAREARRLEKSGADLLHIDVMDGMFVPNITFGACVVRALKQACALPLDVHMMVRAPERYIDDMAEAGADYITVHVEATPHIHRALQRVAGHPGVIPGVALNPGTPAQALEYILGDVGLVLVMTVNPGFGGQALIAPALPKITAVRRMLADAGHCALVSVDGGVTPETAGTFIRHGANVLVSGTSILSAPDAAAAIRAIRRGGDGSVAGV